jgi:glycosyltransferase involved in cell wall biosynthesis
MKVVAVIPALNEEAAIGLVVRAIPPVVTRTVVVDNGSRDRTASVADAGGALVVYETQRGYGAACMAGFRAEPDADVYVFLDGDGSDPPERVPDLLDRLIDSEADLVLGARRGAVEPGSMYWHQRLGNVFMSWLIRRLTGAPVHDLASFKLVRGSVLRDLEIKDRQQGWTAELITACAVRRLRISEVSTGYRRRIGKSKVSGSTSGSLKAAYRLNAAILRVWLGAMIAGMRSPDLGATAGTRRDK